MYDFSQAPQPGFDIARGLAAGFGAVSQGLQAANQSNMLAEWDRNTQIRNAQRAAALDQAQTLEQLGRTSNAALRGIDANRAALYNSSTGYMQAMNAMNPVGQGSSRRLSADGKTIETVNALGQVTDTTPNLRGRAAENALINQGGINLYERAQQLPKQEQFDAELQSRLAIEQMKMQMQAAMIEAGLRGGRGGAGGHGGKNDVPGLKPKDIAELVDYRLSSDPDFAHLPRTSSGMIDYQKAQEQFPDEMTNLGRKRTRLFNDTAGGILRGGYNQQFPLFALGLNDDNYRDYVRNVPPPLMRPQTNYGGMSMPRTNTEGYGVPGMPMITPPRTRFGIN